MAGLVQESEGILFHEWNWRQIEYAVNKDFKRQVETGSTVSSHPIITLWHFFPLNWTSLSIRKSRPKLRIFGFHDWPNSFVRLGARQSILLRSIPDRDGGKGVWEQGIVTNGHRTIEKKSLDKVDSDRWIYGYLVWVFYDHLFCRIGERYHSETPFCKFYSKKVCKVNFMKVQWPLDWSGHKHYYS